MAQVRSKAPARSRPVVWHRFALLCLQGFSLFYGIFTLVIFLLLANFKNAVFLKLQEKDREELVNGT